MVINLKCSKLKKKKTENFYQNKWKDSICLNWGEFFTMVMEWSRITSHHSIILHWLVKKEILELNFDWDGCINVDLGFQYHSFNLSSIIDWQQIVDMLM